MYKKEYNFKIIVLQFGLSIVFDNMYIYMNIMESILSHDIPLYQSVLTALASENYYACRYSALSLVWMLYFLDENISAVLVH